MNLIAELFISALIVSSPVWMPLYFAYVLNY
jgi:hypothetical protein